MSEICQCCGSEIRKYKGTFKSGPNYTISQDNRSVTKSSSDNWNANILGTEEISKGAITIVNLRIEHTDSNSYIMFGLAPKSINQNETCLYSKNGYYFYSHSGGLYCQPPLSFSNFNFLNQKQFPIGTVITMIVDFIVGKISYKINEGEIKTAFHSITFNEPMIPCVLLYTKGDSVRLIN